MAKTVKKAIKAKVAPLRVDTSELNLLLIDVEAIVPGAGTVDDRQKLVDRLKEIIQKFEA